MRNSYLFIVVLIFLSGCSSLFSIGEENTYCREHGCNYADVGICANPVDVLNNKDDLSSLNNKSLVEESK